MCIEFVHYTVPRMSIFCLHNLSETMRMQYDPDTLWHRSQKVEAPMIPNRKGTKIL